MNNIKIPNPKNVERIRKEIKKGGANNLHIISDFDRTLTKAFVDGEKVPSIISAIRRNSYLGEDYAKKAHALFGKYHPIEANPDISHKEKSEKMHEWWKKHYDLLKEKGMNKEILREVVEDDKIQFREGIKEFLDLLNENNIPLIILSSSGIGNCIEMFFDRIDRNYDNIWIISNFLEFDSEGKMKGVKGKIIHPFNKNQASLSNLSIYGELKGRRNVILMGDSLGDLGMVKGFNYREIIKVGFFNYEIDETYEDYKDKFDILIMNDSDIGYVNQLLKDSIANKKTSKCVSFKPNPW